MLASSFTGLNEFYMTLVVLASLPGVVSAVWSCWKRRGSVILGLLCFGSVLVGLVLVRETFRSAPETWFYRISPFLPIASGAIGILSLIKKREDVS